MSLHTERRRVRARSPSASRVLAWLFLAAAGAVVALFLIQAGTFNALLSQRPATAESATTPDPGALAEPAPAEKRADQASVSQSQFTGFDKQRQPFSVRAERAVQDRDDTNKVHLERVSAEMMRMSGEEIAISSQTALYDADKKFIDLAGEVNVSSADQFVATMAKASVAIDDKKFLSEVPVTVVHKRGNIRANGMEISDDGRRILFFNRVKAIFWGTASKEPTQQ